MSTTIDILKMDLEKAFLNNEIDDLYADYILQNADELHPISNGSMLTELMEDLYLRDDFIDYLMENVDYSKRILTRINAPISMKGFM